jgi:hypothetical protein
MIREERLMASPRRIVVSRVETVLVATTLAVLSGCGSDRLPTYPASGTVSLADGTSLEYGLVEFRPVDGETTISARGYIQADGSFELSTYQKSDGAVAGEHLAIVVPPPPAELIPGYIDPKYRHFDTSGLKFVVTKDRKTNRYEIELAHGPRWGQPAIEDD